MRQDKSGKVDEAKGRIRKAYGEVSGDKTQSRKGTVDKAAGKLKQGIGKLQESAKSTVDRTKRRDR